MEVELNPMIGMEFDSVDAAWSFWRMYGGQKGFGVRKDRHNKSKKDKATIVSMRFVCSKEGFREPDKRDGKIKNPRQETRMGCMARLAFQLVDGKYRVKQFIGEHNHELHTSETTHMLRSQRHISQVQAHEIELAEDSGLRQHASFNLMSVHAGGRANIGYTRADVRNYIRSRRARNMAYGEAGVLIQYFQGQSLENPSFVHAYQLDLYPMSLMLTQLSKIYTPPIFELFQKEYDVRERTCIRGRDESQIVRQYVISLVNDERDYRVSFDPSDNTVTCSCRKFETFGILCSHALKVYDVNDVKLLPHQYIIPRWMNKARTFVVYNPTGREKEEDPRLQITQWFRELSRKSISISAEACKSAETYSLMLNIMSNLQNQVRDLLLPTKGSDIDANATTGPTPQAIGFKQRAGAKNKRRHRSCVESQGKKKKRVTSSSRIKTQPGVSCSAPQTHAPELSFIEMLTAPIDHPMTSLEELQFTNDFSHTNNIEMRRYSGL